MTAESVLAWHAEGAWVGAGSDDDGAGFVFFFFCTIVGDNFFHGAVGFDAHDLFKDKFCAECLGMFIKLHAELCPRQPFRITWKVFDLVGRRKLPARHAQLKHSDAVASAARIDTRRHPSRTGANNCDIDHYNSSSSIERQ